MPPKKPAKRTAKSPAAKKKAASAKPKEAAKARAKKESPKAKPRRAARPQAKKPAAKAKPKAAAKKPAKPPAKPRRRRPAVIGIGDEVTFPAPIRMAGAAAREHLSGIVCSIREIRTGMPIKKTKGDLSQYVFEVLDSKTFASDVSSAVNSDTSAARRRVQAYLRKSSQSKQITTLAGGVLAETGLGDLDGWRIVKVHSGEVEPVAPAPAPRKTRKRR